MIRPGGTLLAAAGFATWLTVTALCQHPDRSFDRLRGSAAGRSLVPDWRFFAPNPALHDFHVLHRTVLASGDATPWRLSSELAERSWKDFLWFPDRRHDKSVFDACVMLLSLAGRSRDSLIRSVPYVLLREFVARVIHEEHAGAALPPGFQFAVVRYAGYDDEHDPEYILVSPFVPLAC